ncbi:MAG: hypothetical protein M5U24_09310 [Candidatus Kuenenia sp.]|uniref:hypothetical protein n=1 Tax=Candidatus Kuenenia sp. TaxID=2499824 RepID=UPI0022CC3EE8|nr:hypothetical protein [Candidatus Kuenenia sp.]MCZ7622667.1 hypothetical protein [Candidatus Kuenenia sp.]
MVSDTVHHLLNLINAFVRNTLVFWKSRGEAFARFGYERIYDNLQQMLRPYIAIIGIFQKTKVLPLSLFSSAPVRTLKHSYSQYTKEYFFVDTIAPLLLFTPA